MKIIYLNLLLVIVQSTTLNDLIYTPINFDNVLCIRMNNYNSQIGCQTDRDGDSGVLYPFDNEDELTTLNGLNIYIIAVINASIFTNNTLQKLIESPMSKGLLVIEDNFENTFSPEKSCPGNGFNYGENASSAEPKKCIDKHMWNPNGNWMSYYDIPFGVFIIRDEKEKTVLLSKSRQNLMNDTLKDYPLWGAEMKAFMNAAQDTSTCMRRGTCDPIGGINIFVNLVPRLQKTKPILLFAVKTDATAFFRDLSYGAAASATSIVTLLGVMKALSQVRDMDKDNDFSSILQYEIMFTFLQGESFDYTGSQRLAYDLKAKKFGSAAYNISLDDIKCIIEIGPLGLSSEMYIHSPKTNSDVTQIQSLFLAYNKLGSDMKYFSATDLPPSSYNSFLREDEAVSGVVITDTDRKALVSSQFGSRYDILNLDHPVNKSDHLTSRITLLIENIANVALEFAGGVSSKYTTVNESLVNELLECYLINQNCSLLRQLLNQTTLKDERLSRYSSVGSHTSNATIYLNHFVSHLSKKVLDLSAAECNETYSKGWDAVLVNETCFGTVINGSTARSPAFVLNDYQSTNYSTWTESRWTPAFKVRIFRIASDTENIVIFCCGLFYFVIVSLFIVQCYRQSALIFINLN